MAVRAEARSAISETLPPCNLPVKGEESVGEATLRAPAFKGKAGQVLDFE
jgi:hypothetical protein